MALPLDSKVCPSEFHAASQELEALKRDGQAEGEHWCELVDRLEEAGYRYTDLRRESLAAGYDDAWIAKWRRRPE